MVVPLILLLVGLVNNLCCFATFRRPQCLRIGTGHYLYWMSICNQCNLAFLALRLIHLTLNITTSHSSPLLNDILCKSSSYLLTTSTRLTYWLGSLIALERVYVAWFVSGQWLKRPHIARRIIAATVTTILVVNGYQWEFIDSQISSDEGSHAMCAITFPSGKSIWSRLHSAVTIIDSLAPLAINLLCTVTIICIVTKKKMNATGRANREYREKDRRTVGRRALFRRHSCNPAKSSSSTEKCADREQGTGHWTCLHSCASAVLVAILHRLISSPVSESSRPSTSVSADGVVLHWLHSTADEFLSIHLAVVVLHERMASDEAVSTDDENKWTSGVHFDNNDAD